MVPLLGMTAEIVSFYLVEMRKSDGEFVPMTAAANRPQKFQRGSLHRRLCGIH